ncbi:MAG: hypothetical protein U9N44_07485, partial [Chloroflexota bacterium]|nr:hypothetical protein [Chloroflexota bacterium]
LFMYAIYYSTVRFCLEWLRVEYWTIAGFPTACWISLITIIASISIMIYRRRRLHRPIAVDPATDSGEDVAKPSNDEEEDDTSDEA